MEAAVATICASSASSAARHDDEIREAGEVGEVEGAGVSGPVGADQPGAIDGEAHRQVLHRDVVHDLVVGALQEGRVDGAEGLETFGRHAGSEGHRVLLGDADVEAALGEGFGEFVEAGAARHRGVDRDDAFVAFGLGDQSLGEHRRIAWRRRLGLRLCAGDHVERADAVQLVGGALGRRIAMALLGHHVDQDRALARVAHVLEHRQQVAEIVAVDRADIVEAQLFEQGAAGDQAAPYSSARLAASSNGIWGTSPPGPS